jgi:hypothetical protein
MLSLLAAGCVLLLLAQGWLSCMILLCGVLKWGVWLVKVFPQVLRDFRSCRLQLVTRQGMAAGVKAFQN